VSPAIEDEGFVDLVRQQEAVPADKEVREPVPVGR
jgi:hypothetical protein